MQIDKATRQKIPMLVVDDELGICDFLRGFFAHRGYEVKTALSGEAGLTLVKEFTPQVILLDVRMPTQSGLDVLPQFKSRLPDVRIIMITVIEDEALAAQAKTLGAADYVLKPFSLGYLEQVVLAKLAWPAAPPAPSSS